MVAHFESASTDSVFESVASLFSSRDLIPQFCFSLRNMRALVLPLGSANSSLSQFSRSLVHPWTTALRLPSSIINSCPPKLTSDAICYISFFCPQCRINFSRFQLSIILFQLCSRLPLECGRNYSFQRLAFTVLCVISCFCCVALLVLAAMGKCPYFFMKKII